MTWKSRHWLWLLLLVPVGLGLSKLRFDVNVLDLLPSRVRAVQGLKLYQEHFSNARQLVVAIQAPNSKDAEQTARVLAAALREHTNLVQQVFWQSPWKEHPRAAADFLAYLWFNQPPQVFHQLLQRLSPENASNTLVAARQQLATSLSPNEIAQLSYDPLGLTHLPRTASSAGPNFGQGRDMFASAGGTFRIVSVEAATDLPTYRDCIRWLKKVKRIVRETRQRNQISPEVQVHYTGRPAFVAETSSGMQNDMTKSVGTTILVIIVLFWWAHRRWWPLVWLLILLACILGGVLGLGGLAYGTINVVSVGFAAILLGLTVDYGLVLYQEALHEPGATSRELRRALGPSILWSAVTTSGAFAILNFGGMPGLAQLGSLVAIGVMLGALVMLNSFLSPLMGGRVHLKAHLSPPDSSPHTRWNFSNPVFIWGLTGAVAVTIIVVLLLGGLPRLDHSAQALRPTRSEAYATLDAIQKNIGHAQESYWLLVGGTNEEAVARRLDETRKVLNHAEANHVIGSFTLPSALWPHPEYQATNRATALRLAGYRQALRQTARAAGFTTNSLALTENMLAAWQRAGQSTNTFWPTDKVSAWVMGQVVTRLPRHFYALGLIYRDTNAVASVGAIDRLESELPHHQVWLAGWSRLGQALLGVVEHDFWHVFLPMLALLLFSLRLAFKRVREVALSLFALAFTFLCLLTVMKLAGWSWNLLNLMALPLLLGAGVDYSIHMQLALHRHHGNIAKTRRTVGRALLLCAGTTVTGFGSNIWSSNEGLVSLGQVCAAGVACSYLTSSFLLPVWWRTFAGSKLKPKLRDLEPLILEPQPPTPSILYRAGFWRLGLRLVHTLSRSSCASLSCTFARLYWMVARHRRETVVQNLMPVLNNNRTAARQQAKALFREFALKLVDLWRYEAGLPITDLFGHATGWEHFTRARAEQRGVLLLTPHLGNWEFGGPLMTRDGVHLQVITQAEPGQDFTELRRASRARWNVETLVIGNDSFGFVEIIRRLEAGATVALLMDRPPAATAVRVNLFGRPFDASVAAAELARATGCALLPVYLPRSNGAYAAHILPAIPYERAVLRDREARQKLTQKIMTAFEPIICEHVTQWFHFVPIWPKAEHE